MSDDVRSSWEPLPQNNLEDVIDYGELSRSSNSDRHVLDSFTEDSDLLREEDLDDYGNILPRDIDKCLAVRQIRGGGTPLVHLLQAYDAGMQVIAQFL